MQRCQDESPLICLTHCLVLFPALQRKKEATFNGTAVMLVFADQAQYVSRSIYRPLSMPRHFVLLVSTHSSPPRPLHPLHSCFFPPSLSSVYPPWRGPVMSAPSSDKPSLSRCLFFFLQQQEAPGKGGPALCCSAVLQTGASQAGGSAAQRRSGVNVSQEPGGVERGMRGCMLARTERRWRGHFEAERCGEA